jgi:isopenicillin N synthase-like dioxygenase
MKTPERLEAYTEKGINERYSECCFEQAKRFFALPEEKKMETWTGKLPTEYAGYHPMAAYNRNGWKYHGNHTAEWCSLCVSN